MGRPKGLVKTGGRKAGTPNRNTQDLIERLATLGCDPIEGVATIAKDPSTKAELRFRCYAELAQYVYPKRRATDISLNQSTELQPKLVIEYIGGGARARRDTSESADLSNRIVSKLGSVDA